MTNLKIYGPSSTLTPWRGRVTAPTGETLDVEATYSDDAASTRWVFEVENAGAWPEWSMRFAPRGDVDGAAALVLDVPDGTTVEQLDDESDGEDA